MGGVDVEGLAERLLGDLPVGVDHLGHVGLGVAVGQVPHRELIHDLAEEVLQRLGVGVGIDHHEAGPGAHLALGQRELLVADLLEVPPGRHVLERAVEGPGEAVERAADLAAAPGVLLQAPTAMQAGVGVGLDLVGCCADDDVGVAHDLIQDMVADFGDVIGPAGELPDRPPQGAGLPLVPLPRDVAGDVDVAAAEVAGRLQAQHVGNRMGVGV